MAAVLAPWPFLDGGAVAVLVATIFDGATVEEELLWRGAGGRAAARLGDGGVVVRLGDGGFEVVLARTCDGDVRVGGRVVELRELSLCGVTALPIGPRTRVTVRAGMLTFAIAGTTAPKRLPRAAPVSWRRRAGIAMAALAVAGFGVALQATAPRVPSWNISDSVRVKVSLLMPSLQGGSAPAAAAETRAHSAARMAPGTAAGTAARPAATSARAEKTATATVAEKVPNQDRATAATPPPPSAATAGAAPAKMAALDPAMAQAATRAMRATLEDDARKAAAVQARAAGVVGALAQSRAAFLGDVHVAASDVSDRGAVAVGAGDAASASGAATGQAAGSSDGASDGSSSGASNGSSSGASDGSSSGSSSNGASDGSSDGSSTGTSNGSSNGADSGTLSRDEIGEAYGVGGIGISGIGEGGGGVGDGTIGLGAIGTIGRGGGSGYGVGYGGGIGGLLGHRATSPVCTFGHAEVRGSCDADLIRRVVRAHANEVRFCYEKVLQSRPTLMGRSLTRFLIGVDGRVSASSATGLPEVDACLAGAIRRWQFAPRCAAAVSYPFTFVPADGVYY